jgi:hypothetical protein
MEVPVSALLAVGVLVALTPIAYAAAIRILVWGRSESLNDAASALSKAKGSDSGFLATLRQVASRSRAGGGPP